MQNFLSNLRQHPLVQGAISRLGLNIFGQSSKERPQTWETHPLKSREIVYLEAPHPSAEVARTVSYALAESGAETRLYGFEVLPQIWRESGEAFSRPVILHRGDLLPSLHSFALVIDATGLNSLGELKQLDDDVLRWLPILPEDGRVICICRPWQFQADPFAAASQSALPDLCERWAQNAHRTVHAVILAPQAEPHLSGFLRYLLSDRARFLPSQTWRISDRPQTAITDYARIFEQQSILITGCNHPLGQACARILIDNGATLYCTDDPSQAESTAQLCHSLGAHALTFDEAGIASLPRLSGILHFRNALDSELLDARKLIEAQKLAPNARGLLCTHRAFGLNGFVSAFSRNPAYSALTLNALSIDESACSSSEISGQAELCAFLISPESAGLQGQLFCVPPLSHDGRLQH